VATERIYVGRDNTIDRVLLSDKVAVDLSNATKIAISIGGTTFESTNKATGVITWDQPGYSAGEIRIGIGNESGLVALAGSTYDAEITVFDASHQNGISWVEPVRVEVIADYY